MEIRSKREFFTLWRQGVLGNRTLLWDTIAQALAYYPKVENIGFREVGKAGGGAWELVSRDKAREVYFRWKKAGRQFILDGAVPNAKAVMQGEVCRTERGLESFLCVREQIRTDRLHLLIASYLAGLDESIPKYWIEEFKPGLPPMRITIKNGWHRHRGYLETKLLIEHYMDPSSQSDLEALLELYPDASIEFTVFSVDVGVFPGRNTIFWETRNY